MNIKDVYGKYTIELYPVDITGKVMLQTNFLMKEHSAQGIFPSVRAALLAFSATITQIAVDLEGYDND